MRKSEPLESSMHLKLRILEELDYVCKDPMM